MDRTAASRKAFAKVCALGARASAEFGMFADGDRVLAGLSGGQDSFVLLEVLLELARRAPFRLEVAAATFDPGFPEFNASGIADYCRSRGVPHRVVRLNIPEVLAAAPDGERKRRPCVWCSRLRRGKLYGLARELNINRLALGHHADDILASFLISLARGLGLTTMGPNVAADTGTAENTPSGELRLVRPLAFAPEALVKQAARNFEFPAAGECMYKMELEAAGDRAWAKRVIGEWSERIPDVRSLMLKSLGSVRPEWLLDTHYLAQRSES